MTKEEKTAQFLKEAWCIDGECKFESLCVIEANKKVSPGMTYVLNDSKRGQFRITMSK